MEHLYFHLPTCQVVLELFAVGGFLQNRGIRPAAAPVQCLRAWFARTLLRQQQCIDNLNLPLVPFGETSVWQSLWCNSFVPDYHERLL